MAHYLMSVCYPVGVGEPEPDELERIMAKVGSLNDDLKAAGAWVFGAGLHDPSTATVVTTTEAGTSMTDGPFIESNPFPNGDACPGFVPIGDKYLLATFSHRVGGQYLLGDYSPQSRKFKPYAHGRFNHGRVSPGGVHAPSVAADGNGGVINLLNINDGESSQEWDQIMSLAQQLSLGPDHQLRIAPVEAVQSLRGRHQHIGETIIPTPAIDDFFKHSLRRMIGPYPPAPDRHLRERCFLHCRRHSSAGGRLCAGKRPRRPARQRRFRVQRARLRQRFPQIAMEALGMDFSSHFELPPQVNAGRRLAAVVQDRRPGGAASELRLPRLV